MSVMTYLIELDARSLVRALVGNQMQPLSRAALDWPWVAFEIDGVESDGDGGWSVLVVGTAEVVTDPEEVALAARERHVRWAGGDSATWVRIVPSKVTGRRICASERGISIGFG
jgi:hypothetical protein